MAYVLEGIKLGGCPKVTAYNSVTLEYSVGDILFVATKARKGILERVSIKEIVLRPRPIDDAGAKDKFLRYSRRMCSMHPTNYSFAYIDTYNAIWSDGELVGNQEAIDLAIVYWNTQLGKIRQLSCEKIFGSTSGKIITIIGIQNKINRLESMTPISDPTQQTILVEIIK